MTILDTLNLDGLAAGPIDAGLLGEFLTGAVTVHPVATLAGICRNLGPVHHWLSAETPAAVTGKTP